MTFIHGRLGKNNILDVDDDSIGSQLNLLNTSKKAKVFNQKFRSNFTNDSWDFSHITKIKKVRKKGRTLGKTSKLVILMIILFLQIKDKESMKKHLKEVEIFFPRNKKDRILKKLLYSM